jgi:voltage-gated sodium channel
LFGLGFLKTMKLFLNEKLILILIIVNSISLFLAGFDYGPLGKEFFSLIDNLIAGFFICEVIYKFRVFGRSYLQSNWNRFDVILVLLSLPSFFASLLAFDLSFLLVFRVLRIFKTLRIFRFLPEADHILEGIRRALKASVFIMIGFIIYIFITGLFSFYVFEKTGSVYFANPLSSLYSMFKVFTIEGWFEIPDDVTQNLSPVSAFFTNVYFIFIVMSGGIFGLSLVNSIFVDAMVSDNNDSLENKIQSLEEKIDLLLKAQEIEK